MTANSRMFLRQWLPVTLFVAAVALVFAALSLDLTVPLGPFYWDTVIYYDAASRIGNGQVPSVDFHAPVGPLGYWLFFALLEWFPNAQGLYAASWSTLIVTAPLMALVVVEVSRRSPGKAAILAIPFLFFSVLPFNVEQFYPYPGADGYGIYNRQASQLLYVLLAALLFVRRPVLLVVSVAISLAALFLMKITGFVVALPLVALACLTGRISLKSLGAVIGLFAALLIALQSTTGVVSAYVNDIAELIAMNDHSLLIGLGKSAVTHASIVLATVGLLLCLFWIDRRVWLERARAIAKQRSWSALKTGLDSPASWLVAALGAGLVFESQNWGGQAFIFLWPAVLRVFGSIRKWKGGPQIAMAVFAAAALLPPISEIGGRAVRSYVAQLRYVHIDDARLGPLALVSQHEDVLERASLMRSLSVDFPEFYQGVADANALPSYLLYAEPEFQANWLETIAEGVEAIETYEARTGQRFETILSLNFVNPFPYLMGRDGPRHVSIGADPFRTLPAPDETTVSALEATDLVLWPRCMVTNANNRIREIYAPGLEGRTRVALSDCWDGLVRTDTMTVDAELRLSAAPISEAGILPVRAPQSPAASE